MIYQLQMQYTYHQICSSNLDIGNGVPLVFMSDTDDQTIKKHEDKRTHLEAFL